MESKHTEAAPALIMRGKNISVHKKRAPLLNWPSLIKGYRKIQPVLGFILLCKESNVISLDEIAEQKMIKKQR